MNRKNPILLSTWSVHRLISNRTIRLMEFPALVRQLGFDGIEFNAELLQDLTPLEMKRLTMNTLRENMTTTATISNDFTLKDPELARQQIEHSKKMLELLAPLKPSVVRFYASEKPRASRQVLQQKPRSGTYGPKEKETFKEQLVTHPRFRVFRHFLRTLFSGSSRLKPEVLQRLLDTFEKIIPMVRKGHMLPALENHWGFSSKPSAMKKLLWAIGPNRMALCLDWGNFAPGKNRYTALDKLLPFAANVHAKSYHFNANGEETTIDFNRCLALLHKHHYNGPIVVEYEGLGDPIEGSMKTKALIEKCIEELPKPKYRPNRYSSAAKRRKPGTSNNQQKPGTKRPAKPGAKSGKRRPPHRRRSGRKI